MRSETKADLATAVAALSITDGWRRAVRDRMDEQRISASDIAHVVGTSSTTINLVLSGKLKSSGYVPAISKAVDLPENPPAAPPLALVVDPRVAAIAELRASRDAITADILRLETIRGTLEERIAEAYEARAELDIEIRRQRGTAG